MQTPTKATHRILNSSFTPFSTLANSKVSTNCDISRDQSSSLSKKRFTRKRQSSTQSQRRLKLSQTDRKIVKKQQKQSPENAQDSIQKADKLLQRLSFKRESVFTSKYVKLPTQRSSNNEEFSFLNQSIILGPNKGQITTRNKTQQNEMDLYLIDYKAQLQIKNNQYMILEDENNRMKKQLKNKEILIGKLQKQRQHQFMEVQQFKRRINDKVQRLQVALVEKDRMIREKQQIIEKQQKMILKSKQQHRKSQKQIQMLKIHLDQLMTTKIPKNTLQIVSYRQISLQNKLQQLKQQLNLSKSQRTLKLQKQLDNLKYRLSLVNHDYQNLSLANRVLVKKNQQTDLSVEKKFKNQVNQLKEKMKQLIKEASTLKKQNMSLRKTIFQHQAKQTKQAKSKSQMLLRDDPKRTNRLLTNPNTKRLDSQNKQNSSDQSFSISLSK